MAPVALGTTEQNEAQRIPQDFRKHLARVLFDRQPHLHEFAIEAWEIIEDVPVEPADTPGPS